MASLDGQREGQPAPAKQRGTPSYHSKTKEIPRDCNPTSLDNELCYKIHATHLGAISYVDWTFAVLPGGVEEAWLQNSVPTFFS